MIVMDMKIVEDKENVLLKRRELKVVFNHTASATPKKAEIQKEIASKNSVDESQVIVDFVSGTKGTNESYASVKILNEKPPAPKVEEKKEVAASEAPASQGA